MDKPKGFNRPFKPLKERTEEMSVHCKRCNATWPEMVTNFGVIAGWAREYDYCSKCITPEEAK